MAAPDVRGELRSAVGYQLRMPVMAGGTAQPEELLTRERPAQGAGAVLA
jgi:hypothetical protein